MLDLLHRTRKTACASLLACVVLGVLAAGASAVEPLPTFTSLTPPAETLRAGQPISRVVIEGTHLHELTAENLPAELSLKPASPGSETEWEITGTPTTPKAQTTITLKAENAAKEAATETKTYELTVQEALPAIASVAPVEQTVTEGKPITRVAIQGTHLNKLTAENLPAELSLKAASAGSETEWEITGTPTTPKAQTTITLKAENAAKEAATETKTYELTVEEQLPALLAPSNQTSTVGTAITPVGVEGTNVAAVVAAAAHPLPPGLGLAGGSGKWSIAGTPTAAGTYTVTLEATNGEGHSGAPVSFQWTVGAAPSPPSKEVETPSKPPETPKILSAGRLGTVPTQKPGRELWASFLCEVASCKVQVMATITAGKTKFKLHSARTPIVQGKKVRIALRPNKKQRELIAAALKKHKKVTAALSASIDSSVGRQVTKALVVTVKR